jgi:cyclase
VNLPDQIKVFMGAQNRVNSAVVLGENGTVVIDTQVTLEDGRAVKRLAEESSNRPIVAVVITHEHFDHIAGNQYFSCNIISTQAARADIVRSREGLNQRVQGLNATPPNIGYTEGCELSLGDLTLVMKHEGGHCKGESSIFVPETSTLVTGDLVFNGRIPFVGGGDIPQWISALTRLYALDPELVIPGHGEMGTKAILLEQRGWLEQFMDGVLSSKRRGLGAEEACLQVMSAMNLAQDRKQMLQVAVNRLYGEQVEG